MRDLKELLELLLNEWESNKKENNINRFSGLCYCAYRLYKLRKIKYFEKLELSNLIDEYLEGDEKYLFALFQHNERVEWLKERIKELEE